MFLDSKLKIHVFKSLMALTVIFKKEPQRRNLNCIELHWKDIILVELAEFVTLTIMSSRHRFTFVEMDTRIVSIKTYMHQLQYAYCTVRTFVVNGNTLIFIFERVVNRIVGGRICENQSKLALSFLWNHNSYRKFWNLRKFKQIESFTAKMSKCSMLDCIKQLLWSRKYGWKMSEENSNWHQRIRCSINECKRKFISRMQ